MVSVSAQRLLLPPPPASLLPLLSPLSSERQSSSIRGCLSRHDRHSRLLLRAALASRRRRRRKETRRREGHGERRQEGSEEEEEEKKRRGGWRRRGRQRVIQRGGEECIHRLALTRLPGLVREREGRGREGRVNKSSVLRLGTEQPLLSPPGRLHPISINPRNEGGCQLARWNKRKGCCEWCLSFNQALRKRK